MDSENTVGIDIGGSKIAAGLVRGSSVVQRNELATPKGGLAELLAAVRACVEPLLPAEAALGACTPGLHDPRSGRISRADNVPALTDVDLAAELSALFGQPVSVANDADTRSEEHTSELQSRGHLVCRLLLEKKKKNKRTMQQSSDDVKK